MYIGGIGGPLLLIVIGAVLRWAVTVESSGFNIQLAGLIIFIVGIVGLVVALMFWFSRRRAVVPPPTERVVYEREVPPGRVVHERVVREDVPPERVVHERVVRDDVHDDRV